VTEPDRGATTIAFTVWGPIARSDLPGLSERVCRLFQGPLISEAGGAVVVCDAAGVPADAVTVEALARLRLVALRHHSTVRLCRASDELLQLVAFLGLGDVLTAEYPS
jgi:hypothetical protein